MAKNATAKKTVVSAPAPEPLPEPTPPAPLGNLSAEDLAAIRGTVATGAGTAMLTSGAPASEVVPMTASELGATATEEEISLGARIATLEQEVSDLKKAMEKWAIGQPPVVQRVVEYVAAAPRPASPEEEAAYCRANFDLTGRGEKPHDGIEAWRAAGSPGLAA